MGPSEEGEHNYSSEMEPSTKGCRGGTGHKTCTQAWGWKEGTFLCLQAEVWKNVERVEGVMCGENEIRALIPSSSQKKSVMYELGKRDKRRLRSQGLAESILLTTFPAYRMEG